MPWYALTVPPQGESRAKRWLARQDVFSFYPVIETTRYRLGRQVNHERRFIPGYLFARFQENPVWYHILTSDFVRDVLRRGDGLPGELAPSTLECLLNLRSRAELIEDKRKRAMTIRKGSRVRIKDGAYQGSEVEIIEVQGTYGTFRIELLGAREVTIELDRLEKVA